MKALSVKSSSTSRAVAHDNSHGKALQAPVQLAPNYSKINYDTKNGDTAKCAAHRKKTNNWNAGTNLGLKKNGSIDDIVAGTDDNGHSEELILAKEAGVQYKESWGNVLFIHEIMEKNNNGLQLDLYTELKPCYGKSPWHDCKDLLDKVLTSGSTVTYSSDNYDEKKNMLNSAKY